MKEEWLSGLKRRSAKSLYRFPYIVGSNPTSSDLMSKIIMFFYVKISSKDNQVLKKFFRFLAKLASTPTLLKYFSKQNKRKFITVLKSPHVNKTAQEQFEFRYYSAEFLIDSFKPLTFFLFLKRVSNLSFPGIKLEVKSLLNSEKKSQSVLKVVNPDNIMLNNISLKLDNNTVVAQKKYIQLFDSYGELYLKDLFNKE